MVMMSPIFFPPCRIYANLTLNDLVLYIIKGINLPAPAGRQTFEIIWQ